jgi:hypothetical protein
MDLVAAFSRCSSLADAIQLGLRTTPELLVVDVVIQDEFTHDVIFASAAGTHVVVLDCT